MSTPSPFHHGEQMLQKKLGVFEKMDTWGRKVVRDHMPDQHREFYADQPFMLAGSLDAQGRPWASILFGQPGFVTSPNAKTLDIAADIIPGDPLAENLRHKNDVGLLAIEFHTRRRNRVNGQITHQSNGHLRLEVDQSFGNCPKYIQARGWEWTDHNPAQNTPERTSADRFDEATQSFLKQSDTFFIASAYPDQDDNPNHGVDVSHRGGKPGFVELIDNRTFIYPDYSGNLHFNTFGNIAINPKSGYLFPDFRTGDLYYLTGETDIIWNEEEHPFAPGAERMARFRLHELIKLEAAMPLRWAFLEYSPFLNFRTPREDGSFELTVARRHRESDTITSFYLTPDDGKELPDFRPGQHLTLLFEPKDGAPMRRTYTLSNAPGERIFYRISVKREPAPKDRPDLAPGRISNYLHDHLKEGDTLRVLPPRGDFYLQETSRRPVVLLSAGVGVTPMISMLEHLAQTDPLRKVHFIHSARNGKEHALGKTVKAISKIHPRLSSHIFYSRPSEKDELGKHYDTQGRITPEALKQLLPNKEADYYLCGPSDWMVHVNQTLQEKGVPPKNIHSESFGPASIPAKPKEQPKLEPAEVTFTKSNITATWTPEDGTLLEFAESLGLNPPFSCRSGSCHACKTTLVEGDVAYQNEIPGAPEKPDVLVCCSRPKSNTSLRL